MDRRAWIDERRAETEAEYTLEAPTYDEDDTPITRTHRRFVERVIASCPPDGTILDAPCGTGRYFEMVLAAGRGITGIDQSAGMLARARAKHPAVTVRKTGLQELAFNATFDGVICIDAMENVFPEDWPVVLANLHRAVRPGGLIYLTVEQIDAEEIDRVYAEATADGLPVVRGENTHRGGGYHYYPTEDQVASWLAAEGLEVVEQDHSRADSYGYHHLVVRSTTSDGTDQSVRGANIALI